MYARWVAVITAVNRLLGSVCATCGKQQTAGTSAAHGTGDAARGQGGGGERGPYGVPTRPANPPTPEDDMPKKIAGPLQNVDVGDNVEHKID